MPLPAMPHLPSIPATLSTLSSYLPSSSVVSYMSSCWLSGSCSSVWLWFDGELARLQSNHEWALLKVQWNMEERIMAIIAAIIMFNIIFKVFSLLLSCLTFPCRACLRCRRSSSLNRAAESTARQHAAELSKAQRELAAAHGVIGDMERTHFDECLNLTARCDTLTKRCHTLEEEQRSNNERKEKVIKNLEDEKKELLNEFNKLKSTHKVADDERTKEMDASKKKFDKFEVELNTMKQKLVTSETHVTKLETEKNMIEKEKKKGEEELKGMKRAKEDVETELEKTKKTLSTQSQKLSTAQVELTNALTKLADYESRAEAAAAASESADKAASSAAELTKELSLARATIGDLETRLTRAESESTDRLNKLESINTAHADATTRAEAAEHELASLKASAAARKSDEAQLRVEIQAERESCQKMKEELEQAKSKLEETLKELAVFKEENKMKDATPATATATNPDAAAAAAAAAEVASLRRELSLASARHAAELVAQDVLFEDRLGELLQRMTETEDALTRSHRTLHEMATEFREIVQRNTMLEERIREMEGEGQSDDTRQINTASAAAASSVQGAVAGEATLADSSFSSSHDLRLSDGSSLSRHGSFKTHSRRSSGPVELGSSHAMSLSVHENVKTSTDGALVPSASSAAGAGVVGDVDGGSSGPRIKIRSGSVVLPPPTEKDGPTPELSAIWNRRRLSSITGQPPPPTHSATMTHEEEQQQLKTVHELVDKFERLLEQQQPPHADNLHQDHDHHNVAAPSSSASSVDVTSPLSLQLSKLDRLYHTIARSLSFTRSDSRTIEPSTNVAPSSPSPPPSSSSSLRALEVENTRLRETVESQRMMLSEAGLLSPSHLRSAASSPLRKSTAEVGSNLTGDALAPFDLTVTNLEAALEEKMRNATTPRE